MVIKLPSSICSS